jgi:hypothetical protein
LLRKVRQLALVPQRAFYFNYLLFVPIWFARITLRSLRLKVKSENEINTPLINRLLSSVFAVDVAMAPWLRAPFGVSALVLIQKPTK